MRLPWGRPSGPWAEAVLLCALVTACGAEPDEQELFRGNDQDAGGGGADEPSRQALIVDAGQAQSLLEGDQVTLGASVTGGADSFTLRWSQLEGPAVQVEDPTAATTTFTAPAVGETTVLVFRVEVEDSKGQQAQDDVSISVASTNQAPEIQSAPDVSVGPNARVTISATAVDTDGDFTVAWQQIAGPPVELMGADTLMPTFMAPDVDEDTELVFEVVITDDDGEQDRQTVVVVIDAPTNLAPVLNAGAPQAVTEGDDVTLDGTAQDDDGSVDSVQWTQLAGPEVELTGADTTTASFTAPTVATDTELVFELTVTDEDGGQSRDTVTVLVQAAPLQPPLAAAGGDRSVSEGEPVTLDGTASDDGSIASVAWTQIGGPDVELTGADTATATFTAPAVTTPTTLVFQFTATDDDGATRSDTVLITITPVNTPPTVDAGGDTSFNETDTGVLDGSADDDGSIALVTWRQLSGPLATLDDDNALDTTFTPPDVDVPEVLVFELEVTDDEGATARDTVTLFILPVADGNIPPSVFAGASLVVPAGTTGVQLSPVVSDEDGSIVRTTWSQVAGDAVALSDENVATPTFDAPAVLGCAQNLLFELEVEDDDGATARDTVGVLVSGQLDDPTPLGTLLDFEADGGGLSTDGTLWQLGAPTSGPGSAHSGGRVWATNLTGAAGNNQLEQLCLPPIARDGAARMTLSVRSWVSTNGADAVRLEGLDPALGWQPILTATPPYQNTGLPGHTARGRNALYDLGTFVIPSWTTDTPHLRFVFQSNGIGSPVGAYLDDLGVHSEDDDPDGDGLTGVEDEWRVYGTDPFRADSDDDGETDGAEVAAGTDPLNPADFLGVLPIGSDTLLDFETDSGNLYPLDLDEALASTALWQHGSPSSGPSAAHSGNQVWGTNIAGNFGANERAFLYLRPLDLSASAAPTLSMRIWSANNGADGTRLEVYDPATGGWSGLSPRFPDYNDADALTNPAWGNVRRQDRFRLAAFDLTDYAGQQLFVRLAFRSSGIGSSSGMYIDDLGLHDETSDPDGDGLLGIMDELLTHGTDPFVGDTDGDGIDDGVEILTDGTNPLDGSDYLGSPVIAVGTAIDFDLGDGGFSTTTEVGADILPGDLWQYGAPASGPARAHTGANVWATNLGGNFAGDERSFLNLPPLDLTGSTAPTLSFRLWALANGADGLSVEIQDATDGQWVGLVPALPDYNATDALGNAAWGNLNRQSLYSLVAVPLDAYAGSVVRVRLAFRSNGIGSSAGAYVDDFALFDENDDPDGDGLPGVINERQTHGTDPFVADSDGDSLDDGTEVLTDGTDPLNPAWYAGGPILSPGTLLDFDVTNHGLASMTTVVGDNDARPGYRWQHGAPASGPGRAHSGGSAWGTQLDGSFAGNDRSFLHLPPIDLSATADASLSMRVWGRVNSVDGLSVEFLSAEGQWLQLTPLVPAYNASDASGVSAWGTLGYQDLYTLVILPLTDHVGGLLHVRLAFRSNAIGSSSGFYVDDIGVHSETDDPDADGLQGIATEWNTYGTDPLVQDSDGDLVSDGDEENAGPRTDPLNPGDYPGASSMVVTDLFDLEASDGGFASERDQWQWGAVASGPGSGASGQSAWATNLSGSFQSGAREYLYSPPLVLPPGSDPTFGFHLWMQSNSRDGVSLEIWDDALGWQALDALTPAYDGDDADGISAWTDFDSDYRFAAVSLSAWAGETVWLRFAFRANTIGSAAGAYLDDFALFDDNDTADADGDGLPGLKSEFETYGTDPLASDTDGDGVDDGQEVADGTDPLDSGDFIP